MKNKNRSLVTEAFDCCLAGLNTFLEDTRFSDATHIACINALSGVGKLRNALLKEPLFSGAKPAQSKAKTRGETRGKGGAAQTTRILRQAVGYWLWPAAS